jgi:hypothetical protein
MTDRDQRAKDLKTNIQTALEELVETSSKYPSDSDEVNEARVKRAREEKALFNFLDEGSK